MHISKDQSQSQKVSVAFLDSQRGNRHGSEKFEAYVNIKAYLRHSVLSFSKNYVNLGQKLILTQFLFPLEYLAECWALVDFNKYLLYKNERLNTIKVSSLFETLYLLAISV